VCVCERDKVNVSLFFSFIPFYHLNVNPALFFSFIPFYHLNVNPALFFSFVPFYHLNVNPAFERQEDFFWSLSNIKLKN
jgi:hypothetical protein